MFTVLTVLEWLDECCVFVSVCALPELLDVLVDLLPVEAGELPLEELELVELPLLPAVLPALFELPALLLFEPPAPFVLLPFELLD